MYGVPADLDLSHFRDATCIQVAIGEFQVQFLFYPTGSISVEGRWELRRPDGRIVDRSRPLEDRVSYRIHRILGHSVRESFVRAPQSFGLRFENGYDLEIFDDSEQFESCQLLPMGIII
jgi:hypothetical protein